MLNFTKLTLTTMHLVIIEGNISAGKSTLTTALEEQLGYRVFLEPTLSNPYLELFYKGLSKIMSSFMSFFFYILNDI